MENIIFLIIVGALAIAGVLAMYLIIKKMPKEKRKELIKEFIIGAIVKAEKELGSGTGKEKLEAVEKYFEENAPTYYQFILETLGRDSLVEIIEEALSEVKKYFGGKNG